MYAIRSYYAEGLPLGFSDVDLCLRAGAAGRKVVWTPAATLSWEGGQLVRGYRDREPARMVAEAALLQSYNFV